MLQLFFSCFVNEKCGKQDIRSKIGKQDETGNISNRRRDTAAQTVNRSKSSNQETARKTEENRRKTLSSSSTLPCTGYYIICDMRYIPWYVMSCDTICPIMWHVPWCDMSHDMISPIIQYVPWYDLSHYVIHPMIWYAPWCDISDYVISPKWHIIPITPLHCSGSIGRSHRTRQPMSAPLLL